MRFGWKRWPRAEDGRRSGWERDGAVGSRPEDGRVGDAAPTKGRTGARGGAVGPRAEDGRVGNPPLRKMRGGQAVDDVGHDGGVELDVDGGLADGGGEDPADAAVLDFLVAEHSVEHLGGVDATE